MTSIILHVVNVIPGWVLYLRKMVRNCIDISRHTCDYRRFRRLFAINTIPTFFRDCRLTVWMRQKLHYKSRIWFKSKATGMSAFKLYDAQLVQHRIQIARHMRSTAFGRSHLNITTIEVHANPTNSSQTCQWQHRDTCTLLVRFNWFGTVRMHWPEKLCTIQGLLLAQLSNAWIFELPTIRGHTQRFGHQLHGECLRESGLSHFSVSSDAFAQLLRARCKSMHFNHLQCG